MTGVEMSTVVVETIHCACGAEKKSKPTPSGVMRLPQGWKRLGEAVYCQACWRAKYILRAVTIPIAGPVGADWKELRAALSECWAESTALANWTVTELAKADVIRQPSDQRLGKMPAIYLYGLAKNKYAGWGRWEGAYASAQSLMRAVEAKYRKKRLEVVWRHAESLPSHRYPVPYPAHNQAWSASYGEGGEPLVSVTLAGQKFSLRLRGGHGFRRQLKAFGQIVGGQAVAGELAIYRQRANGSDHRNGVADRKAGGGTTVSYRVMAKLVAWLPREAPAERRGKVMRLATSADHFLMAAVTHRPEPWIVNADNIRQKIREHRRFLQRMAEDLKFEKRWPARMRRQILEKQELRAAKQNRRLDTFAHQAVAQIVGFAARQGVSVIEWRDTDGRYADFPWHKLLTRLSVKCDEFGIVLRDASGEVIN